MKTNEKNQLEAEEHFFFYPTGTPENIVSKESNNAPLEDEEPFFEYACVELKSSDNTDGLDSALGL
jgi:hypothetical protein